MRGLKRQSGRAKLYTCRAQLMFASAPSDYEARFAQAALTEARHLPDAHAPSPRERTTQRW